jgi:hypothetical protein
VPDPEWSIWYRDLFDRECPASEDVRGQGVARGLTELWARHLFEGVNGLSAFELVWTDSRPPIGVVGDLNGARRLRAWMFGARESTDRGYVADADARLLAMVVAAHIALIRVGESSERILAAARNTDDRGEFETQLRALSDHGEGA